MINIRSTWGDKHYVGLNGIEVFTSEGKVKLFFDTGWNLSKSDVAIKWTVVFGTG